jgi:type IV secretory pathway VirB2 component (pilin)
MKSLTTYIQIAALAACFAVQFHPASVTGTPGTRKAMQTLEVFSNAPTAQTVAWSDQR